MGAMPATPIVDQPSARLQLIAGELMYRVMSWVRAREGRRSVWFDLGLRLFKPAR
jgi:hypothetical protein